MSFNIEFCRVLYRQIMEDVRREVPPEIVKEAWVYNFHDGRFEFQIPSQDFYWYGQADNAWDAKTKGWESYLSRQSHAEGKVGG